MCYLLLLNFETKSQIIVIDAGHGYNSDCSNGDGRSSTEINTSHAVSLKLRDLIQGNCSAWTVHLTRPNNGCGSWVTINDRALMSNNWNADRILSIHCNAGGGTGTESFWCNDSPSSNTASQAFATEIQSKMVQYGVWSNRRTVEDNTYLAYHLGVLKYSNAIGSLNEIGFVDYASDATKLLNDTWRNNFAQGYYIALQNNLGSTCGGTTPPSIPTLITPSNSASGLSSPINFSWSSTNANEYRLQIVESTNFVNWTAAGGFNTSSSCGNCAYNQNVGNLTSQSLTGFQSGKTYYWTVRASGTGGVSNFANNRVFYTANTTLPGSFSLTVTPECSGTTSQNRLDWTTSSGATSYDIYRGGSLYTNVTGTQFINTSVTVGTSYSYYVQAKNANGSTNNSNGSLSGTPPNCSCIDNPVLTDYNAGSSVHIKAPNTINANNKIYSGANVIYQAGRTITLTTGFKSDAGSNFKIQIGGCNN